jgi:hypothetical protein
MKQESLRVDVSGPTDGDKLFMVSASPSLPKAKEPAGQSLKVKDAVTPETVLEGVYPRTHNGDKVKQDGDSYVVSRRVSVYSYRQGHCRLDQKVLEVQKIARDESNQKFNSLVDVDAIDAKSERRAMRSRLICLPLDAPSCLRPVLVQIKYARGDAWLANAYLEHLCRCSYAQVSRRTKGGMLLPVFCACKAHQAHEKAAQE